MGGKFTDHMLCLKMSSVLVRIREPSGAEGLPAVECSLDGNRLKTSANMAREKLCSLCIYSVKTQEELQNVFNIQAKIPVYSVKTPFVLVVRR